jgi:hypothetical protein
MRNFKLVVSVACMVVGIGLMFAQSAALIIAGYLLLFAGFSYTGYLMTE